MVTSKTLSPQIVYPHFRFFRHHTKEPAWFFPFARARSYAGSAEQISVIHFQTLFVTFTRNHEQDSYYHRLFSIRSLSHEAISSRISRTQAIDALRHTTYDYETPSCHARRKPAVIKRYHHISRSSCNGSKSPNFVPSFGPALHSPPRMIRSHCRHAGLHSSPRF
ncbi:hypothetical protein BDN72DRAFT_106483 [Pluteus cervinus]|uniref:Uncharacterized protein n=1 Tax=Pluteus cervinus TaxID=181527 RepID=A0ACD3AP73_9AGAR|nr:hypothetical protein BDN72DRAFT_106483 [Pluteus cervinus]